MSRSLSGRIRHDADSPCVSCGARRGMNHACPRQCVICAKREPEPDVRMADSPAYNRWGWVHRSCGQRLEWMVI